MVWYLNPALTRFREAVNARYPGRDKTSDGTIGDLAHQATASSHNPDTDGSVDAWDMDVDLRSGDDAKAIEELKRVFEAHESSSYWIHNDQIALRSEGWRRRSYAYAGPGRNRHSHHVHWNSRESHENSTEPWVIPAVEEDDMPTVEEIWAAGFGPKDNRRTAGQLLAEARTDAAAARAEAAAVRAEVRLLAAAVSGVDEATQTQLQTDLDAIEALVASIPAETVEALGAVDSPEEIADRLRAALGDKAAAVGAFLVQG